MADFIASANTFARRCGILLEPLGRPWRAGPVERLCYTNTFSRLFRIDPASNMLFVYIALAYLVALLLVPFYIGIEPVENAQINLERGLLILLAASVAKRDVLPTFSAGVRDLFAYRNGLALFLTGYFLVRAIAAALSPFAVSIPIVINDIASNFFVFLAFFVIFSQVRVEKEIARILEVSVLIIAGVVALELVLGFNVFTSLAPEGAGKAINEASIQRSGLLRVKGPFEHPLTLAHMVVMILPLFLFSKLPFSNPLRVLCVVLLVGMGFATGSRSGLVLVAFQLGLWAVLRPMRINLGSGYITTRGVAFAVAPLVLAAVLVLAEQRSGSGLFESHVREAQIRNGLIAIREKPFFGFGPGPGAIAAITEGMRGGIGAMKLWRANLGTVDNWYLSVLLSSGFMGFAAFILLIGSILYQGVELFSNAARRYWLEQQGWDGLALGLLIGCTFGAIFMAILSIFTLHPLFFILAAWLTAITVLARRHA
ncbi:O-antigen ligase family protein [Qipengyuania flava]|uniref:O-antigen ligase family protein n=1 Tax=Qipengyuania flava TaxID=192812 RepID=UPI001C632B8A|nr:O-antigen ligase family protein [Qipengyuania flava]QYJ06361.1 hypothetical protein KUV82_09755 [Qipengyuania flava]